MNDLFNKTHSCCWNSRSYALINDHVGNNTLTRSTRHKHNGHVIMIREMTKF